eukprot:COSAG01_NODE_16103_length_1276_cov_1.075149_2_plen_62_part_00
MNAGAATAVVTADWPSIGLAPGLSMKIRDTIRHMDNGTSTGPYLSVEVASHDVAVLVLSPT